MRVMPAEPARAPRATPATHTRTHRSRTTSGRGGLRPRRSAFGLDRGCGRAEGLLWADPWAIQRPIIVISTSTPHAVAFHSIPFIHSFMRHGSTDSRAHLPLHASHKSTGLGWSSSSSSGGGGGASIRVRRRRRGGAAHPPLRHDTPKLLIDRSNPCPRAAQAARRKEG